MKFHRKTDFRCGIDTNVESLTKMPFQIQEAIENRFDLVSENLFFYWILSDLDRIHCFDWRFRFDLIVIEQFTKAIVNWRQSHQVFILVCLLFAISEYMLDSSMFIVQLACEYRCDFNIRHAFVCWLGSGKVWIMLLLETRFHNRSNECDVNCFVCNLIR